jgi:hypothetical protein
LAKQVRQYVCAACGAASAKWSGRCEACGAWNTLAEESAAPALPGGLKPGKRGGRIAFVGLEGTTPPPPRVPTTIAEFDRVLGGGLVPASVVLVGGDPGIGKSTLLLQASAALARAGQRVLYISGEESIDQIRLRAGRLGLTGAPVALAAATQLGDILAGLAAEPDVALVVIDSIQTMWMEGVESAPGSVTQVRGAAFELIRAAKTQGFALILVGHVTKEGGLAGPRVLEHMVDVVLHFEGDRGHQFRILRGAKNRFGATDEIGVFEMTALGLAEVANPSALFLAAGQCFRQRRFRRAGGLAAGAGGNSGAAGAQSGRGAAAIGDRLGFRAAVDAAGGAGDALRAETIDERCVSECRRRPAGKRAGGGPSGGGGADLGGGGCADRPADGVFRRNRALGRAAAGGIGRAAAEGGGETGVQCRHRPAAGGRRRCPDRGAGRVAAH